MSKAKYWFEKAKKEKFAIGAFNGASEETLKAIVGAAKNQKAPVVIEASPGEIEYFGIREFVGINRALEQSHGVPIILNLDHALDFDQCILGIDLGFDYIHFDGSRLNLPENTRLARQLVDYAHSKGILVEGEIDGIPGSSADHRHEQIAASRERIGYTDPEKAAEFVQITGVDTFASFVGNVHGLYSGAKRLDLGLLEKISRAIPDTFLSLHGGSGVPAENIRAAINLGVIKVNVNSELRVAFHDKLKEILDRPQQDEVAIYKFMPEAISAVQEIVEAKIKLFGSMNKL